jgi:hypothetical protein
MKKTITIFILFSIFLSACSSSKKSSKLFGSSSSLTKSSPKPTDNGLSYDDAIVITETKEGTGVKAAYNWIKNHYSDYSVKSQSLNFKNNKAYDIITILFADKKELLLYFDISNYFGNF